MTGDLDRTTILLSIRPVYVKRIFAGEKTHEFRRRPTPTAVTTLIFWRTEKGRGLVGYASIVENRRAPCSWWLSEALCGRRDGYGISLDSLTQYAGGVAGELTGLRLGGVTRLDHPVDPGQVHDGLHRARPPQSWRYAPEGWRDHLPGAQP